MAASSLLEDPSSPADSPVLRGESAADFARRAREILEAINPTDGVQQMLADRVVKRNWGSLRSQRATDARAAETIDAILDEAGDRHRREVRRLAPLVDGDPETICQLRAFPAGVDHLREEWTILQDRLSLNRNLLGTQRLRCFSLAATRPDRVFLDDAVATRWLRAQIGVMLGQEGTLEDVASFMGTPPEGMFPDEVAIRVSHMAQSLLPREASFLLLKSYVSQAIDELTAHRDSLQKVADRRLQNAAVGALADSTPEGTRLANQIHGHERSCDAALRRLEVWQKGEHPGPKPGPKKAESPVTASRPAEQPPEPAPAPAVVAAVAQVTVAAEVPAADVARATLAMIPEAEPKTQDDSRLPAAEPRSEISTVEPTEPALLEPRSEISTVEPTDAGPA